MVADTFLEIWPNTVKVVKIWEKLSKSQRPGSESYGNLVSAVGDPLITVKLTFFSFIFEILEPFLNNYQNDKPMLLFMYGDIKNLVKSLLQIIIKPEQLEKCKNGVELKNLNLDDQTLHVPLKNMEMGYGVANISSNLCKEDIGSNQQVKLFKEEAQSLLITVLKKLFIRTPPNIGCAEM